MPTHKEITTSDEWAAPHKYTRDQLQSIIDMEFFYGKITSDQWRALTKALGTDNWAKDYENVRKNFSTGQF